MFVYNTSKISPVAIRPPGVCLLHKEVWYLLILFHIFLQGFDMGAAAVAVDVETIRLIVDDIGFRAQCIEYCGTNHPAAAV